MTIFEKYKTALLIIGQASTSAFYNAFGKTTWEKTLNGKGKSEMVLESDVTRETLTLCNMMWKHVRQLYKQDKLTELFTLTSQPELKKQIREFEYKLKNDNI